MAAVSIIINIGNIAVYLNVAHKSVSDIHSNWPSYTAPNIETVQEQTIAIPILTNFKVT